MLLKYSSKAYVNSVIEVQGMFLEYIILIILNIRIYNIDYMYTHTLKYPEIHVNNKNKVISQDMERFF